MALSFVQAEPAPEEVPERWQDTFWDFFETVGLFALSFLRGARGWLSAFYRRYLQRAMRRTGKSLLRGLRRVMRLFLRLAERIGLFFRFFTDAGRVVKKGFFSAPKDKPLARIGGALRAFAQGVRNNAHVFVTLVNYALPVVAILICVQLIQYVRGLDFAVNVEYNGQDLGYIENENVFDMAKLRVIERLNYLPDDPVVDDLPKLSVVVIPRAQLKTAGELTDAIIQTSSADMVQATGIYLDGELLGVVRDYTRIESTLNRMLDEYKLNQAGERVEFVRDLEPEPGLYLADNLSDEEALLNLLTSETEGDVYYTVVEGDTPGQIAAAYDMDLDDLERMNPGILESLLIGQQVLVNKSKPFLEVMSTRVETYTEEVDFKVTYVSNPNLWEGTTQVVSAGIKGEQSVTAEVSYVSGTEVSRKILSTVPITEAVNQVVAKGTKPMKRDPNAYIGSTDPDSGMMNPVSGASPYISQVYGHTRWESHHNAIDIAFRGNGYGTDIYSVLPGTVTYAGRQGSYGNLVIVNHGNGIQTWYAHCSKLYVRTGDTVAQGETIAGAGSTGNSSGVHLHFRVIVNGQERDPEDFIPGYSRAYDAR